MLSVSNQGNPEGKGDLVQLIPKIYAQVTEITLWPGAIKKETNEELSIVKAFFEDGVAKVTLFEVAAESVPYRIHLGRALFGRLCRHTHWTRPWVVHEFTLAQDYKSRRGAFHITGGVLAQRMELFGSI